MRCGFSGGYYAECRYDECHRAESHGAPPWLHEMTFTKKLIFIKKSSEREKNLASLFSI
jgi:hypothetical protein